MSPVTQQKRMNSGWETLVNAPATQEHLKKLIARQDVADCGWNLISQGDGSLGPLINGFVIGTEHQCTRLII